VTLYALRLNVAMEARDERQLLTLVIDRIRGNRQTRELDAFGVQGGTSQWH